MRSINTISLLVNDYDDAIAFYTGKLGFHLLEDTPLGDSGKRWVLISPDAPGTNSGPSSHTGPQTASQRQGCNLLLAQASDEDQKRAVGNQAGGRVMLFLTTDDFWRDHKSMIEAGVLFRETPREELYGIVAVFEDLYGNPWDLIQPR